MPYNFIYDEDEVLKFHQFMHPLKNGEVYFVSMAARDKYLTAEERVEFSLGRSQMFGRKLVKNTSFIEYIKTIRSMEVNDGGYITRNGKNIPAKCMVVYANINASCGFNALKEFNSEIHDLLFNMPRDSMNTLSKFANLDSALMNCYQRQSVTKHLIDVDFDVPKNDFGFDLLCKFIRTLRGHKVDYKIIETHGGYHVLMVRETIKFNYGSTLTMLNELATSENAKSEIVRNVNNMVPLPGTYQSLFPVRFIEIDNALLESL